MIVAAHQPNFLPWLGYFDKMRKADMFVLVDHVQFERQNYQNRSRIKTREGPRWITVPVLQGSRDERICEKRIDNSRQGRHRWGRTMYMTLMHAYRASPHFETFARALEDILDRGFHESLLTLNRSLIELCRDALGIRTPLVLSSDLEVQGAKSDMVLDLCRRVGADVYLAGTGGSREYLDVESFKRSGIQVLWQEFSHPRYEQCVDGPSFVEGLSVLDLIFNCGPGAGRLLSGAASEGRSEAPLGLPKGLVAQEALGI